MSSNKVTVALHTKLEVDSPALSVAFSPNGEYLALGTEDGLIIILSSTWKDIQYFPYDYGIYAVEWSPDGLELAIGGAYGPTKIFDTKTWEEKRTLPDSDGAMNLSWSSDGQFLAVGSFDANDGKSSAEVWSTKDWKKVETHNGYLSRYASFSNDSKFLAIDYHLDGVEILAVPSFTRIAYLDFSDSDEHVGLSSPVWSADDRYVAASCDDGRIRIWRTNDWSVVKTFKLHGYWDEAQYRVLISPNNQFLVSGGFGTPKLISTVSWKEIYEFEDIVSEDRLSFSWHPNNRYLAVVHQSYEPVMIYQIE